jgi:hypothetical protein
MQFQPLDPPLSDVAPADRNLTENRQHLVTYLRLLDADAEGADLEEVASINPTITSVHGGIFSASKLKRGNSSAAAVAKA